MKKKLIKFVSFVIVAGMSFSGCSAPSGKPVDSSGSSDAAVNELLKVDKEKNEVTMETEVNAKYFTEPTRHGVVYKDGGNGEKSILRGLVDEKEFYEALMSLNLTAGNNVTLDDMKKGVTVDGDKLDVFVTWEGLDKEIPFKDIVKSSDDRTMDIRFGGNIDNAKDKNTGCILCLDSCAVGITSNASYETGASDTIKFYGNQDVLPADGTRVTVIFRKAA